MGFQSGRTSLTTVQTTDLVDNAVTLAKMAGGTDGNLIGMDASGDPAYISTGTDGQVLTSGGAGVAASMEDAAGGAWEFVSAVTAAASGNVAFTGFEAGYDYRITGDDIHFSANSQADVLYGTGATPTYQSTLYRHGGLGSNASATHVGHVTSAANIAFEGNQFSTGSDPAITFEWTIYNPADASADTRSVWTVGAQVSTTANTFGTWWAHADRNTAEAVTAWKLTPGSGNIASGNFRLYRRALS